MIERIGTNAGLVWNALNSLGKMDIKALRKATKLRSDKELFAAIGWLAKEGKLLFDESGEELLVELAYECYMGSTTPLLTPSSYPFAPTEG